MVSGVAGARVSKQEREKLEKGELIYLACDSKQAETARGLGISVAEC